MFLNRVSDANHYVLWNLKITIVRSVVLSPSFIHELHPMKNHRLFIARYEMEMNVPYHISKGGVVKQIGSKRVLHSLFEFIYDIKQFFHLLFFDLKEVLAMPLQYYDAASKIALVFMQVNTPIAEIRYFQMLIFSKFSQNSQLIKNFP